MWRDEEMVQGWLPGTFIDRSEQLYQAHPSCHTPLCSLLVGWRSKGPLQGSIILITCNLVSVSQGVCTPSLPLYSLSQLQFVRFVPFLRMNAYDAQDVARDVGDLWCALVSIDRQG